MKNQLNVAPWKLGLVALALVVPAFQVAVAQLNSVRQTKPASLMKIATNDSYAPITVNNIFNFYGNNGDGSFNKYSGDNEGFEFPRGTGGDLVYDEGVIWGGKHNGVVKVGGSWYWHGLQAGRILTAGVSPVADNPSNAANRIFRVRPDVSPTAPFDSAMRAKLTATEGGLMQFRGFTVQQIYNEYIQDWNNWPASYGAPYTDVNKNGVYEPGIDIPGVPGADQTLWYVANDLDSARVYGFSGQTPIGLEMQRTIWVYNQRGTLGNTVLMKTRIINKSGYPVDSMYIAQWADPDIGGAVGGNDDLAGCDTILSLAYAYNGTNKDGRYQDKPPAVGYALCIGPCVPSSGDSGFYNGMLRKGYKNLRMTSFVPGAAGVNDYTDPPEGVLATTTQWYHILQGLNRFGVPCVNSQTGLQTRFVVPGDPVTGTGWIDGTLAPPGDRRITLSSGPLTLAVGDTQEVVTAAVVGQGSDRLSSVTQMKSNVSRLQAFIHDGVPLAGVDPVSSLYVTNSTISLHGSIAVPPQMQGVAVTGQWIIVQKPTGSIATINTTGTGEATFRPDIPGSYKIGYQALLSSIVKDVAYLQFQVTSNQPPVADFQVLPQVTVGDTIRFDASASFDPEPSDSLRFSWLVSGDRPFDLTTPYDSLTGRVLNANSVKASYNTLRAATVTVYLIVSDSFWTTNASKTVVVNPIRTGNVQVSSVFPSGLFPQAMKYGFGPFRSDNNGVLWTNSNGDFFPVNFSDFIHPTQNYQLDLFGNYTVNNGTIICANGTNGVVLVQTDGNSTITNRTWINPGAAHNGSTDTTASEVYVSGRNLFFSDGMAGVYAYDITNPASPVQVSQFQNGQFWGNFVVSGTTLIGVHARTGKMTAIDISNPSRILQLATNALPHPYSSIRKYGSYYYLLKSDTIGIYDLSNLNAPVLKVEGPVPKTINSSNVFNDIAGDGSKVILATMEGLYVYDVTNPTAPTLSGKFVTGTRYVRVYMGSGHTLAYNNSRGLAGGFEGLNVLQSVTGVAPEWSAAQPVTYRLYQNYPNPFNPSTMIQFALPKRCLVSLKVFDLLGREVATLVSEELNPGFYRSLWHANAPSGVYFYRIQTGEFSQTKRLVLLK